MTVNIEGSAQSISKSLGSLKTTHLAMHRITFMLHNTTEWYAVMQEARRLYGKNWRGQPHIRRKFNRYGLAKPIAVWFEVPDPAFTTWMAVKHAVIAQSVAAK